MPSAPLPAPKPATAEVVFVRSQGLEVAVAETTVGQYRRCVDAGACRVPTLPPPKKFGTPVDVGPPSLATPLSANSLAVANGRAPYTIAWSRGRDDLPVDQVDWTDANRFCTWARARLPTAEEWRRSAVSEARQPLLRRLRKPPGAAGGRRPLRL